MLDYLDDFENPWIIPAYYQLNIILDIHRSNLNNAGVKNLEYLTFYAYF